MDNFDHERLDVYQVSMEFIVLAHAIVESMPRGNAYINDQLGRAATSITLNIAEGAGAFSPKEKARFYRIAKRSATECAAILDVAKNTGKLVQNKHSEGRTLLIRIVSMLIRMVCNISDQEREPEQARTRARARKKVLG